VSLEDAARNLALLSVRHAFDPDVPDYDADESPR
jgi:hypothetical protein